MTKISKNNIPQEVEKMITTAVALKKQLKEYEDNIKSAMLEGMIKNNIKSIKNENYTISLVTRKNYKVEGDIPQEFSKEILDTSKVSSYTKLYGKLPESINESEIQYITWRSNSNE